VVATQDSMFLSVLRNTVQKQLAVGDDCITTVFDENQILKSIKDASTRRKNVLVFVERVFNNKETAFLIKQIKAAFGKVKVVILTGEADRQRLVLLHEIGADNFISKPISVNTLIEKIAFTIKPQGKIGKLIDAGKQMLQQGEPDQALKLARRLLEIKPNSAAAYLIMGDAYRGMGKRDKAVQAYEDASEQAPMYMEPLKRLAEYYGELGERENQLDYLEKLDRLSPLNVERKVDMGEIHVDLGNEKRAEELFDNALKQARKEAMSYIEEISSKIGDIYTKTDPERAEKYYREALDAKGDMLDRSDIRTFNMLGIALRKQGRWKDAVSEYHKAMRIAPEDESINYNTAMAWAEGKEYGKALQYLNKALEGSPDFYKQDPTIAYNIGLILSKAGQRKRAKEFLEYALELNPGFESAKRLLNAL
jgi:tetratricopeptide (TPR) repeat protein